MLFENVVVRHPHVDLFQILLSLFLSVLVVVHVLHVQYLQICYYEYEYELLFDVFFYIQWRSPED